MTQDTSLQLFGDLVSYPARLRRSKRRTLALVVTPEATLIIRAPMKTSLELIQRAIATKKDWILNKIQAAQQAQHLSPVRRFIDGQKFLYLGKELTLRMTDRKDIQLTTVIEFPARFTQQARKKMISWYSAEAQKVISTRVEYYEQLTGWHARSVKISSAEKRWGSCAPNGDVRFSWKLMMVPLDIIDYVVVHELAHVIEHNHSQRFWKKVASVLPDYKTRRKWLRDHQRRIYL